MVGVWEGLNLGSIPNDHMPSQKDPKIPIERRCSTILPGHLHSCIWWWYLRLCGLSEYERFEQWWWQSAARNGNNCSWGSMMGNFGRKIWSKCIVQMVQQRKCNKCPELRSLRDSNALPAKSFVIISRVSFLQELQSHLSEQAWKMNSKQYIMHVAQTTCNWLLILCLLCHQIMSESRKYLPKNIWIPIE